jgi:UDPglucose 6-dehydrogenase
MNIAIVGTGYVGLVTGTCFAETGNYVTCADIDPVKVDALDRGEIPIYEPGLELLFERNRRQGRLRFTTRLEEAVADAQIVFLALPTPSAEDGSADLSYVLGVARDLAPLLKTYTVVVDKSTVPVGTAEAVAAILGATLPADLFDVVSNPEFLREGVAVEDFMRPDRVVVGVGSERAKALMEELYAPFVRQGNPIVFMDIRSAELTKYAANAYLAMRISFMNEIANLCERLGADVDMVRMGLGSDSRIGKRFLFAGAGYGGSCFPKDVKALINTSGQYGYDFRILRAVLGVNDRQRHVLFEKISVRFDGALAGRTVAVWGLAFKPNTDDIREAPALYLISDLLEAGAKVRAHDPAAMENVRGFLGDSIELCGDPYDTLQGADCLAIVTEWSIFRTPDFGRMAKMLRHHVVFDGRNLYDLKKMEQIGFEYFSIGRRDVRPPNAL